MKLEITTEEVLELASKNEDLKLILKKKFPECFNSKCDYNSDDLGIDSIPINKGDLCYIIHGTPDRYTITEAKYPNCSSGAIQIFRGDAAGKINAELYIINKTKRFTLNDIEFAINYCGLEDHIGTIISRLNDKSHPDTVIHHTR